MISVSFWNNPTTKDAYTLSIASIILELISNSVGFWIYNPKLSPISLIYVSEKIAAILSSTAILWRFFAPFRIDEELEQKLLAREEKASIATHLILSFLNYFITLNALGGLLHGWDANDMNIGSNALHILPSLISTIVFTVLCIVKIHFSRQLGCESLLADGILTFIGSLISAVTFIHAIGLVKSLWWIEPSLLIIAGRLAYWYGEQTLYQKFVDALRVRLTQQIQIVSKEYDGAVVAAA